MHSRVFWRSGLALACFFVVSCGGGGDGDPPRDTSAPDTQLGGQPPALTSSTSVTFSFGATEPGVAFESSLDGAAFAAATSPQSFSALADGSHTFAVRARDAAGNTDPTPATSTWTVDSQAPDTTLVSAPPAGTVVTSGSINVSSPDAGATFEGKLDDGAYAAISLPYSITSAPEGAHTLSIRARDAAGNVDSTPVVVSWTYDLAPSKANIQFPPSSVAYTSAASITIRGTASDASGIASLKVNGIPATTTNQFATWSAFVPLSAGSQFLRVDVVDAAGLENTSAASVNIVQACLAGSLLDSDFDPTTNRVVVLDDATHIICAYPAAGGAAQLVADLSPRDLGVATSARYSGLTVEPARNRILLIDKSVGSLLAVSIATGALVELSPAGTSGISFGIASNTLALDTANNRALVLARNNLDARVIAIDLTTGARSIAIPSVDLGNSLALAVDSMVYDNITTPGTPRLLVERSFQSSSISAVDMATGTISDFWVSPLSPPSNFGVYGPKKIMLDAGNRRLIAFDTRSAQRVLGFDLDSGTLNVLATVPVFTDSRLFPSFDRGSQRLYVAQYLGAVDALDLATQTRTNIGNSSFGSATSPLLGIKQIFVENTAPDVHNLLLYDHSAFYRLALATGTRTTLSGDLVGSGPPINGLLAMPDTRARSAPQTMLVARQSITSNAYTSVDLASGNRVYDNSSPVIVEVEHFALDGPNNRVFALVVKDSHDDMCSCAHKALYVDNTLLDVPGGADSWGPFEYSPVPVPSLIRYYPGYEIRAVDLNNFATTTLVSGGGTRGPLLVDVPNEQIWWTQNSPSNVYRAPLRGGTAERVSGVDPTGNSLGDFAGPLAVDSANGIAYALTTGWWMVAVDTVSGERVAVTH